MLSVKNSDDVDDDDDNKDDNEDGDDDDDDTCSCVSMDLILGPMPSH